MPAVRLLILGAGRFAADVADWAADIPGVEVVGFFQDQDAAENQTLDGLPVLTERQLREGLADYQAVCAVGSAQRVAFVKKIVSWGLRFTSIIHPSARVSGKASIGPGAVIAPLANVAAHVRLGAHVIVNRSASLGHHAAVEDFVFVGPGAVVAGASLLERAAFLGAGAVVRDGIRVGAGATLGAGSVAVRDLPPGVVAFGVPARVLPAG